MKTPTPTITIVPNNDIIIRLKDYGRDNDAPVIALFSVSADVLSLASPRWRMKLESDSDSEEPWELSFMGDDLDALTILLHIAHLNFGILPESISFDTLYNLSMLCDKYDCIKLLRPWTTKWVDPLKKTVDNAYGKWLFIAWTFGESEMFMRCSQHLAAVIAINEDGDYYDPTTDEVLDEMLPPDSQCEMIRPHQRRKYPSILDELATARLDVIEDVLNLCTEMLRLYLSGSSLCQHRDHVCNTFELGSFIKDLVSIKLFPIPGDPM